MDKIEARILLKNLIARIDPHEMGGYVLQSKITNDEYSALGIALTSLGGDPALQKIADVASVTTELKLVEKSIDTDSKLDIDTSVLDLSDAPQNIRICLDFGTAMSKATLVIDGETDFDDESINVLSLGEYGDGREDYKLTSAVYIDDQGNMWFGEDAVEYCVRENVDESRQVMDNIKHWLSLGQVDSRVDGKFNPTEIPVTYADIILAYLTFLTWSTNKALEKLKQPENGFPRNTGRRFALPCLPDSEFKEVQHRMRKYLGEAQILSDSFYADMRNGISLRRFVDAVHSLRKNDHSEYKFVLQELTEPLGVAGSLLNYGNVKPIDMIVMVIDVGAGTTDFSVYRMKVDPENGLSRAWGAVNSVDGITEAGNHLDGALMGFILQSCGINPENGIPDRVQWHLQRNIREYKEDLFDKKSIEVSLPEGYECSITLGEFMRTPSVVGFSKALDQKMISILESIHNDWIQLIGSPQIPYLTVALTGGGSSLPMVRELADRQISVNGRRIKVVPALPVPAWLMEAHSELELDYPSVAVSLGGARKRLIEQEQTTYSMGGNPMQSFVYDDPKYQW